MCMMRTTAHPDMEHKSEGGREADDRAHHDSSIPYAGD
jgi:hypothetical protein